MSDVDPKVVSDVQNAMAFAAPFASALVKLRRAEGSGKPCQLSAAEVKAVIEGFRMLNRDRGEHRPAEGDTP